MIKIEHSAGDCLVSRWLYVCQSAITTLLDGALWLPRFWIARSELGNLAIMTERDCQDVGLTGCEIERYLTHRNRPAEGMLTTHDSEDRRAANGELVATLSAPTSVRSLETAA
jgi:hypothetical protein